MNSTTTQNGTAHTLSWQTPRPAPSWGMVLLQGVLAVAVWAGVVVQLAIVLPAVQGRHDLDGERERLRLVREQEEVLKRIQAKSAVILAIQERQAKLLKGESP